MKNKLKDIGQEPTTYVDKKKMKGGSRPYNVSNKPPANKKKITPNKKGKK